MYKPFLVSGAILGLLSVGLGAFGAHSLQDIVTNGKLLHGFQTGVQYQMYHALALLATGILFEKYPGNLIRWAGRLFISGVILFSGSLYFLAALNEKEENLVKIIGPVTPTGGVLLIAGWLLLLISLLKNKSSER